MRSGLFFLLFTSLLACTRSERVLQVVTHEQFSQFVAATGYVTDAERYGWSVVQEDVYSFKVVKGATWRKPDGIHPPASERLPVTQVSYADALAYCSWAHSRLPSYEEYWQYVQGDDRLIVTDGNAPISPVENVNIVGNVWELTQANDQDSVRLAGGSLFCSETTCHGTSPERHLMVDRETANIHIGFAVLKDQ